MTSSQETGPKPGNIGDQLWVWACHDTTHPFISRDVQNEIIQAKAVAAEFDKRITQHTSRSRHEIQHDTVQYACSKGKQIYAILALLGKEVHIEEFKNKKITDADLPFLWRDESLVPKNHHEHFTCFDRWTALEKHGFYAFQWYVTGPRFEFDPTGKPQRYDLCGRMSVPWFEERETEKSEIWKSGHSYVRKVRISESHHGFREVSDNCFAWKALRSRDQTDFEAEFKNLMKLGPHKNLTPLLTAFTHKGTYNFLFPWAKGGNLRELWKGLIDPEFSEWALWVAEQCSGLADGLSKIHDIRLFHHYATGQSGKKPEGQTKGHDPDENDKIFGIHGDIKPKNVLLFSSNKEGEKGVLKFTDFGLTVFHSSKSVSRDRIFLTSMPLTYNAPEGDADRKISRGYDIWCLGCLYLEMITWLLLGFQGLKDFGDLRTKEHGARKKFDTDQFFKKQSNKGKTYKMKDSVTSWIRKLQGHDRCSLFIYDFLEYVRCSMLVIDSHRRKSSQEVSHKLEALYNKCQRDEGYLLQKRSKTSKTQPPPIARTPPASSTRRYPTRSSKRGNDNDEESDPSSSSSGKRRRS